MPLDVHWRARLVFLGLLGAATVGGWYFLFPGNRVLYEIDTHASVSGLTAGAPVEMHGVEVGTVRRIKLTDPRTVRLVLSIDRDTPVTQATTAILTARGLVARGFMGYVYIALENSGVDERPLPPHPGHGYPIITMAEPQIETLDTTAVAAIQELRGLTHLLENLLDPSMVSSLKDTVHDAGELLALLITNQGRLRSLIANIERDTGQIGLLLDEKTVTSLKQSADGLQEVVATLATNSRTMTALMSNAEQDSRDLKPLLNGTGSAVRQLRTELLPQLYRAVGDLDRLTHAIRPLASRADRDPAILLRGTEVAPGPGER
jgi:phospholipid/cholesterol/gamma-HCH transport system substrate-binding protein